MSVSCSASGKVFTINVLSSLGGSNFELHIANAITNPKTTAPTSTFVFETQNSGGSTIESLNNDIFLEAEEGGMASFSLTPDSSTVGSSANLEVRFRANHEIPQSGKITVAFPKWNPLAPSS